MPICNPEGKVVCSEDCAPRLANGLIQQIFKHRALTLKTVGTDVCQVVGNDVHIGLLGIQGPFWRSIMNLS